MTRIRGGAGLAVLVALASACGASGPGAASGTDGDDEVTALRREIGGLEGGFDVAAGEDTAWLLVAGEPAEVWQIGSDGTMTRRAEVAGGGDEIAAFGDGAVVTRFRCTDPADDECGAPFADLVLLGPDGAVEHELRLTEDDARGLEGAGMRVLGSSDDQIWVDVSMTRDELFAVSRSGGIEKVPAAHFRQFANDRTCAVGGELVTVRVHTDLWDPEQGPSETGGVAMTAETPVRTIVGIESFAGGAWQPMAGSERTFDTRGSEAWAVCESGAVRVQRVDPGAEIADLARWTPQDGWADGPAVIHAPSPPDTIGVDGCDDCAWRTDGEILRRGDDGTYQPTGLVVADPDGAAAPPEATEVDLGPDGTTAACASFPRGGPTTAPPPPPGVTVTFARAAPGPRASQPDGRPLVCDR